MGALIELLLAVVEEEEMEGGGQGEGVGATDQVHAAKNIDGDLGGLRFSCRRGGGLAQIRDLHSLAGHGALLGGDILTASSLLYDTI